MTPKKTRTNLLLAFSATMFTAILFFFLFFNIGIKNRRYTYEDSKTIAREISRKAASETGVYLSSALIAARSMEEKALIYKKLGGTRQDILRLLLSSLNSSAIFMGAWTMWEPNAFDNRDGLYRHDTLYDANGTMSIAFFKYRNTIQYERNDPADYKEDFYKLPRQSSEELILDPFHYQYHGHSYIFYQTSAVVPILVDSVFLGVFGIDINLDSLQHKLNRIRLYETGSLSLITASGIIVSQIDSAMIGRNFFSIVNPADHHKYDPLNEGRELTIETTSEFSDDEVFRFFYPIQVGHGTGPWYIMVEIPVDKATTRSKQLLYTAYVTLMLGLFLLSYLIINIFDRRKYERNLLGSMQRVEESKKIIADSERNFRNIFDKSKDVIIILGSDTRILAANHAFTSISGYSFDEGPLYVSDIILSDGENPVKERLSILSDEDNLKPFEFRVRLKDGQIRVTESNSSEIDYYGQKAYLIILRDVTLVREAEHKVMEAVINTEESERSRIAQDLHDGLGPVLSTIKLYFQVYQETGDEDKKQLLAGKLTNTIQEAMQGISEISHNISPHVLKNYGFYAALRQFIQQIALINVIKIKLECKKEPELGQNTGITLYRAITELINNSIKHARCRNISIVFSYDEGLMHVQYTDDGKGFNMKAFAEKQTHGSGFLNIMNRIHALQGTVEISSAEGKGMKACLTLPL
jgi:PAS domain S-box-containing protein